MRKILRFFKEMFLNMAFLFLVCTMLVLMYINWTNGLNMQSVPEEFFAYEFVMSILPQEENENSKALGEISVSPSKLALKTQDATYSVMYDSQKSLNIYNELFLSIYDNDREDIFIDHSSLQEYLKATENTEFVYMEFLCPLSAIIDIETDVFVTDMVAYSKSGNINIFIKSNNDFYKITFDGELADSLYYESLSEDYDIVISDKGIINLVSDTSFIVSQAIIATPLINDEISQNIISTFLYNPSVVTNYETVYKETIYVNEYSTASITNQYVEFESTDPRGNIFNEQSTLSNMQKIDFSIDIFNKIYSYIDSDMVAYPFDFYVEDGQDVVIISAKYNGIDVNIGEPFGIFVFSSSGLSYCKVNVMLISEGDSRVSLTKTNLLNTENRLIITYGLDGYAAWKYYFDEE